MKEAQLFFFRWTKFLFTKIELDSEFCVILLNKWTSFISSDTEVLRCIPTIAINSIAYFISVQLPLNQHFSIKSFLVNHATKIFIHKGLV